MISYGREIIKYLFGRRHKRGPLLEKLESRREAFGDRSHIGMLEARLSAERHGDYEQSTGAEAQSHESALLIDAAGSCGLFIPREDWQAFGVRKCKRSGESAVYFNEAEGVVTKVRNPFAKSVIKRFHAHDAIY